MHDLIENSKTHKGNHKLVPLLNKLANMLYMLCLYMKMFYRLFYAGAMEGQMPEVLTMIQTDKHTPAPAVLFVV